MIVHTNAIKPNIGISTNIIITKISLNFFIIVYIKIKKYALQLCVAFRLGGTLYVFCPLALALHYYLFG